MFRLKFNKGGMTLSQIQMLFLSATEKLKIRAETKDVILKKLFLVELVNLDRPDISIGRQYALPSLAVQS